MTDLVTYTHGMVNHYKTLLDERARSGPAVARMQETILGLFQTNTELAKAAEGNVRSLCDAVLSALNLGLSFQPSLGQAYLVPRKGRVCFQLGYRGLMELARRSGAVVTMSAELVYPGDRFEVSMGTERRLVHVPDIWGTGRTYEALLGAYATATMQGGAVDFEVMPKAEIERRRDVSMSKSGPWREWPEEMARKTVLRALLKRLPLSVEAADLIKRDYTDDDARESARAEQVSDRPRAQSQRIQHPQERAAIVAPEVEDAEVSEGPDTSRLHGLAEACGLPSDAVAVYLCARNKLDPATFNRAAEWCNGQTAWKVITEGKADRPGMVAILRERAHIADDGFDWGSLGPKRLEAVNQAARTLGVNGTPETWAGDVALGVALYALGVDE